MSEMLKIKVAVANRMYPLTIARKDEESVRKAAKNIEDLLKNLESNYAVRDKQDLVAMAALQFAIKALSMDGKTTVDEQEAEQQLKQLEENIADLLNNQ